MRGRAAECAAAGPREPGVPSVPSPVPAPPSSWSQSSSPSPGLVPAARARAFLTPVIRALSPAPGSAAQCAAAGLRGARRGPLRPSPPASGRPALLWPPPSLPPSRSSLYPRLTSPSFFPLFPALVSCHPSPSVPFCTCSIPRSPKLAPATQVWWTEHPHRCVRGGWRGRKVGREGPEMLQSRCGACL